MYNDDDIVISGVSGRYPSADSVEELWNHLLSGVNLATPETIWPTGGKMALPVRRGQLMSINKFDHEFFKHTEEEANLLDPQIRLFHEITYEAIYDAGMNIEDLRGSNTGVYIGTCYNDTESAQRSKQFDADAILSITASRISATFDFRGPSFVNDTACASSLSCLNEAYLAMKNGLTEKMIVGGLAVHLNTAVPFAFRQLRMISHDGCSKCLDKDVDGYCRSESVVAIFLQKRKHAKRIYASIVHSKTNTDGYKEEGITFPKYETQKKLMKATLEEANVDPLSVTYIEAHMTGTAAGDVVESRSIIDVYRANSKKPLKFGCIKSNLGHSEGASGCVALSKVCLVFQQCLIPPNINYRLPNPNIEALMNGVIEQVLKPTPFDGDIIPVNSFGFGGVNIHALLKGNEKRQNNDSFNFAPHYSRLVTFSGRSTESVEHAFQWIENNKNKITNEFLALVSDVSSIDHNSGFNGRGFIIMNQESIIATQITDACEKSKLFMLFPGLNYKKNKSFSKLMKIEPFAKAIEECSQVLKSVSFDLKSVLSNTHFEYNNIVEALVSTVAFQIAIFETLKFIGIKADAFIGESIGEICAAFADGCLNKYEAIWATYYIASTLHEQKNSGLMVAVEATSAEKLNGLSKNLKNVGTDMNGSKLITGSQQDVGKFVQNLQENDISVEVLETCGKSLHNLDFEFCDLLCKKLQNLFNNNKTAPQKWKRQDNDDIWEYLSRCMFDKLQVAKIPANVSKIDIQSFKFASDKETPITVKTGTDNIQHATVDSLFVAIGKMYNMGHNVCIKKLYPKVNYPVPRETASLSQLLKWNHTTNLHVLTYPDYFQIDKGLMRIKVDLADPSFKFIDGHYIDGRLLYPATGYMYLAASSCIGYGEDILAKSVQFTNLKFKRATLIPKDGSVTFSVNFNHETGEFEIFEGGSVCATGFAKMVSENQITVNSADYTCEDIKKDENVTLFQKDIYKELRIRGYDYGPNYQCLEEVQSDGSRAKIKWNGSWVNFLDSVLQMSLFERSEKILYIPVSIDYMLFNCELFEKVMENEQLNEKCIFEAINVNRNIVVGNGAVIIRNILGAPTNRRIPEQEVTTITEKFVSFKKNVQTSVEQLKQVHEYNALCSRLVSKIATNNFLNENLDELKSQITTNENYNFLSMLVESLEEQKNLTNMHEIIEKHKDKLDDDVIVKTLDESLVSGEIDIVLENNDSRDVQYLEVNSTQSFVFPLVQERIYDNLMTCSTALIHPTVTNESVPKAQLVTKWDTQTPFTVPTTHKDLDLIVFKDYSTSLLIDQGTDAFSIDLTSFLDSSHTALKDNGFLFAVFREKISEVERQLLTVRNMKVPKFHSLHEIREAVKQSEFSLISEKVDSFSNVCILLRKTVKNKELPEPIIVETKTETYEWIENLKEAVSQKERRVWLLATDSAINGCIGFVKCLRKEAKGVVVRCLFGENAQLTQEIIQNDLLMNVMKNNEFGSFQQRKTNAKEMKKQRNVSVLNIETKGDLSSLKWFESQEANTRTNKIDIYYAALNFKDVMVAAGKVPVNAYPMDWRNNVPIGMEYSGVDSNNNRVCGFCDGGAIASQMTKEAFNISVPDKWTLEEAATVPVVYFTVYYALFNRGQLRNGESILIHAGSGGVGQAALSVCLKLKCNIFVTVGSEQKKEFLLKQFPELKAKQIGNSRDVTFEELILKETDGRGVDVILNSLAEEKLRASVRCLARFGRFIEIGKYDLIINSPFDAIQFEKNQTFHVVCVAHLTAAVQRGDSSAERTTKQLLELIRQGIESGEVRPLQRTVFEKEQSEEAFRYIASGKHIGKVLIKIKDERSKIEAPTLVIPQTYFSADKSYLITGGLGGFGLEVADWMVGKGATKLVLTSRNGFKDNYQRYAVKRMRDAGAEVEIVVNDCTTENKAFDLLQEAKKMGPVGGIFNLNLVLKDAPLDEQTVEAFNEVCASKVHTTIHLDRLSRKMCPQLDYFVCFSSIAALIGNTTQTNYGFANSVMERICERRRDEGLHGTAIQWGSIGDVGFVAENFGEKELLRGTILPQRMPSCLQTLDRLIQSQYPVVSSYLRSARKSQGGGKDEILKQICHVLGVKDPEKLDPSTTLNDLGMDSLMAVEIKQGLEREYDTILSTQEIRNLTVKQLKEIEMKKCSSNSDGKKNENKLSFNKSYLELATEVFTPLNDVEKGIPIFFFPPIEGNFNLMSTLTSFMNNRPIIGVNWTAEINELNTIKDIAVKYMQLIREQYNLVSYDFVGYSFGACIALETSIQMQATLNVGAVKKLILLDGSPQFLKLQVGEAFNDKSNKAVTEKFMDYITKKIKLETLEIMKLREELLQLNSKEKKARTLSEMISGKLNEKCDPALLLASIDRMSKKLEMITEMTNDSKFHGILSLIRAKDVAHTLPFKSISNDYGLSEYVDGKINIITKTGHHESFITMNAEDISRFIEDEFCIELV